MILKIKFIFIFYLLIMSVYSDGIKMLVNYIRHGSRTPGKIYPEVKHLFDKMDEKKLTLPGFKQMLILGKFQRSKLKQAYYKNLLDIDKIPEQVLIFSSPSTRAVESSVAYSLGLLPEYIYKLHYLDKLAGNNNDIKPPILDNYELNIPSFNIIIEDEKEDILFHAHKRCNNILNPTKVKPEFNYLTPEDRKELYEYLSLLFPRTLHSPDIFHDKLARSIYSTIRCINKNYSRHSYNLPEDLENKLSKLFNYYNFFYKHENEEVARLAASAFFEHLLLLFEHRINNTGLDNVIHLKSLQYNDLRYVTYSGHDGNLIAIMRTLVSDDKLKQYFDEYEKYKNLINLCFGSNIEFHLVEKNSEYYVRILINEQELLQGLYSHDKQIPYKLEEGIRYSDFKIFVKERIIENYNKCDN
jgi:hypothetical protein